MLLVQMIFFKSYLKNRKQYPNSNVVSKFNELYLWCVRYKLTINCDKTNFILFHATNKPAPYQIDEIVAIDMTIKRVRSFQYLGLTLDETS